MSKSASKSSWKTTPMPARRATLSLSLTFTEAEFQKLRNGFVPEQMEDKWFIYYEHPWLSLHQSWTGTCIYQVRFDLDTSGWRIVEALANRDPSEYFEKSEEQDVLLLSALLYTEVGRDAEPLWDKYIAGLEKR